MNPAKWPEQAKIDFIRNTFIEAIQAACVKMGYTHDQYLEFLAEFEVELGKTALASLSTLKAIVPPSTTPDA